MTTPFRESQKTKKRTLKYIEQSAGVHDLQARAVAGRHVLNRRGSIGGRTVHRPGGGSRDRCGGRMVEHIHLSITCRIGRERVWIVDVDGDACLPNLCPRDGKG